MDRQVSRHDAIRRLMVVLTAGCNLACSYCFQNTKDRRRRMSWEVLRSGIDWAASSRNAPVELLFFGGEPLLEFGLIERAVGHVRDTLPPGRLTYGLITNGLPMTPAVSAFLDEHDFDVQVSFDGVPAAQAERGEGTFAPLDRLLRRLRADHPGLWSTLSVSITLQPRTVPHLAASVAYLLERGVRTIAVSPVFTDSSDWRREDIAELDRQFEAIYRLVLPVLRGTGGMPLDVFRSEPYGCDRPDSVSMCGVGRGDVPTLDVDGTVNGCSTFARSYQDLTGTLLGDAVSGLDLGHVDDPGLGEAYRTYARRVDEAGLFSRKERKHSSYGNCGDCRYLADCAVCPSSIGQAPGNRDPHRVPDFLCAYNLVSLKYRDLLPRSRHPGELLFGPDWRRRVGTAAPLQGAR